MMMPSIFRDNVWSPWSDFSFPDVDRVLYGKNAGNVMKTDITEKDGGFELDIDLPGFKKEDVSVKLEDGYLTVSAAKNVEKNEEKKDGKYIRRERYSGNMSRSFYVGKDVTQDEIHAKYENGILMLAIPKKEEKKPVEENHYITIEG